jgi:hypothetical protein
LPSEKAGIGSMFQPPYSYSVITSDPRAYRASNRESVSSSGRNRLTFSFALPPSESPAKNGPPRRYIVIDLPARRASAFEYRTRGVRYLTGSCAHRQPPCVRLDILLIFGGYARASTGQLNAPADRACRLRP